MVNSSSILKSLEYSLWIVIVISLTYVGHFYFTQMKSLDVHIPTQKRVLPLEKIAPLDISTSSLKPYNFYEKQINNRDIFSNSLSQNSASTSEPQVPLGQLPGNFKIVGIVLGNQPQIVIEDAQAHQTYFIDKGTPQVGIQIDRVENDKMILIYKDQPISISLKGSQINVKQTNP